MPKNPNLLNDMMLFVRVVNCNSFTAAAKQMKLSKSIVSKRISRLEQNLKVRLLNRSTRKLSLTEAGQVFFGRCSRISEDVEAAELEVMYTHKTPKGWIRITAPLSFGYLHISPAIADFIKEYPKVKIDLHLSDHPVDLIEESYDIGIRLGKLEDSNLIAKRLAARTMFVCGSPKYFKEHGIPEHPTDLVNHDCFIYEVPLIGDEWRFTVDGHDSIVKVHGSMMSNNGRALLEASISGLGLVFLPEFVVSRQLKSGKLQSVLGEYCQNKIELHATYPHNRHLARKVRYFIDFLAERFQDEKYWGE